METLVSKLLNLSDEELDREIDVCITASIEAESVAQKVIFSGLLSTLSRIRQERTVATSLGCELELRLDEVFADFDEFIAARPYLSEA